jgi:filamentous hemagglutinin family protein
MANRNSSRSAWTVRLLCSTALALVIPSMAHGNPTDGSVATGSATIVQTSTNTLSVNQTTQKAVINWQSFSIDQSETTNFIQPSASAITLNRVTGVDPSSIMGNLTANGQVWLINPNGIAFGKTARVDVAGLLATTIDIADRDFMSGNYRFSSLGNPSAMVTNAGQITVRNAGLAALVAPSVENSGLIQVNLGQIQLSSAAAFTVDLYGDGLFNFTLDKQVTQAIKKSDGTKPTAAVSNSGQLIANGGRILLTANAAKSVVDHAINMDGYAQATSASVSATGEITLDGGSDGDVRVAGTIDASGQNGANGGTIKVLADKTNGTVDLSGTLDASTLQSGNGGFVETSAAHVKVSDAARITTSAPSGTTGTWLVDPHDYTVAASGGDISGATLSAQLASNNVTILSNGGTAGTNGDVNVNDAVSWSAHTLTLTAANNINVNAVMSATGTASLALNPATGNGSDSAGAGQVLMGMGIGGGFIGRIDFSGTGTLSINGTQYTVINSLGVESDTSTTTLQGMQNNLSGHYVLGSNIDASATGAWNASIGFSPIGESAPFTGVFDGLGHTITGLSVSTSSTYNNVQSVFWGDTRYGTFDAGLFGQIGSSGVVRNVGLEGGAITDMTSSNYVGGLAGNNSGHIANSYSTMPISVRGFDSSGPCLGYGVCTSTTLTGTIAGGLVGLNSGTISNSYASGAVAQTATPDEYNYGTSILGGLAGINSGVIKSSYATGTVSGVPSNGYHNSYAGGLVGTLSYGTVENSFATGDATGGQYVGGLIGNRDEVQNAVGSISNVYSTGSAVVVSTIGIGNSGGLMGVNGNPIINGYWDAEASGNGSGVGTGVATGMTGLTTAQMKSGLPAGFDPAIWAMDATINGGYPYLRQSQIASTSPPQPPVSGTLTWSVADAASTYGTLASLGAVTLTGVSSSDIGSVSGTVVLFDGTTLVTLSPSLAAGTYTEQVTGLTGASASNYTLATTGNTYGVLTINPKTLTWKTTDYSSTYGTLATLPSPILVGVLSTDVGNVSGVIGLVANDTVVSLSATTSAGSYSEIVSSLTGTAASNYTLSLTGNTVGTFAVNPKALTWSVSDASYAYGSSPNIGVAALTGIVGNDKVDGLVGFFSGTTPVAITSTTSIGSYAEKVVALTNTDAHNYTLASTGNRSGTLTVHLSQSDATQVTQAQSQTASALLAWNSFVNSFGSIGDKLQSFWNGLKDGISKWLSNSATGTTANQSVVGTPTSSIGLVSPALSGTRNQVGDNFAMVSPVLTGEAVTTWGFDASVGGVVENGGTTSYAPIDSMTLAISTSNGAIYRTISAYPNVDANGKKDAVNGPFQCTALVAQYLSALGFKTAPLNLPNGNQVATWLGTGPDAQYFQFSPTGANAPKVGSIVSFSATGSDATYGHVAIIKGITQPDPNTIIATLIEDNMTVQNTSTYAKNREITFHYSNGKWVEVPTASAIVSVINWVTPITTPLQSSGS